MAGVPKMQEQFFGRPPWMAGVPKMQEQFFGRPPWMAGVPKMQEQFFGRPPWMAGVLQKQDAICGRGACVRSVRYWLSAPHSAAKLARLSRLRSKPRRTRLNVRQI